MEAGKPAAWVPMQQQPMQLPPQLPPNVEPQVQVPTQPGMPPTPNVSQTAAAIFDAISGGGQCERTREGLLQPACTKPGLDGSSYRRCQRCVNGMWGVVSEIMSQAERAVDCWAVGVIIKRLVILMGKTELENCVPVRLYSIELHVLY